MLAFRLAKRVPVHWPRLARPHSVHSRYAKKLEEKARLQGITVDELLEQAKPQADELVKSDVADILKQASHFRQTFSDSNNQESTESTSENEANGDKPSTLETRSKTVGNKAAVEAAAAMKRAKKAGTMELDTYVDVEKFKPHSREEIEMLWKARFLNSTDTFSGSMLALPFSRMYVNARKYPTFVLPLPHKAHGIELHYVQWSFVSSQTLHCLVTSLAQYKLHGEYAHPHTTFMMHMDFVASKDIVLTNSVVQDKEMTTENAALLVLNLQRFYAAEPDTSQGKQKLDLLRQFNSGDRDFSVDNLIAATETLD